MSPIFKVYFYMAMPRLQSNNDSASISVKIEIIAPEIHEGVEYIHVGQSKLVDGVKIEVK